MPSGDGRRANERPQGLGEIVPGPDEDQVPEQREPGGGQADRPPRVRRLEHALAGVANGEPLAAVAAFQHQQEPGVAAGAPLQEAIAGHAREAFRNARLARAWLTMASRRRTSASSTRLPFGVSAK